MGWSAGVTVGKPDIPSAILGKWQRVVDLAAQMADVPASLVMKTDPPDHSVFVSSESEGNPYEVGQSFVLNNKLYCFSVLENCDELLVPDANSDPDWNDNQDLDHGMSFYIGYPLAWPDGTLFGTICVLDKRNNEKAMGYRALLQEFRQLIESDLALLVEIAERKRLERQLQDSLGQLEARVTSRTRELKDANTALRVLLANMEASRQEFEGQILRQITELILPHMTKLRTTIGDQEPDCSYLDLVESNLKSITSSFADKLVVALQNLTPTEVEVAQMVMNGRTTKDIAQALSRETSTIDFHRKNIRRKLGIERRGMSLRTHLLSLQT